MNADGLGQTNLTKEPHNDFMSAWSSDGSKIAFTRELDAWVDFEVYVINADQSGQTNLTKNATADYDSDWGPEELPLTFYWKDYNGEDPGGYMPDIDQNQDFDKSAIALDFDDDDAGIETMPGWTSFIIAAYSPGVGYGWDTTANIDDRKRASGNALQKDLHYSPQDRTFKVDLPNGNYIVTVYIGDGSSPHDNIDVSAEGVLMLDNVSITGRQFKEFTFPVTISDGQLDLLFHDDGGTDPNWVANGIKIIGIEHDYCAPVAEANSLWWLNKKDPSLEIFGDPYAGTGYAGYAGGDINGDGLADILDLVQDLAIMMKTNVDHTGTTIEDEQAGIDAFLQKYELNSKLYEHTVYPDEQYPDCLPYFSYIEGEVERSQDVKLDLGFWHVDKVYFEPSQGIWKVLWSRRGGHAVTIAGVDSQNLLLAISDSDNDAAESGGLGITRPLPGGHPLHPYDPTVHNNEMFASHDIYTVGPSPSPGGKCGLLNYPFKWNFPENEWETVVQDWGQEPPPLELLPDLHRNRSGCYCLADHLWKR